MPELIVVTYPDLPTAEAVRSELLDMQEDYLVSLRDAVIATRDRKGRVKLNHLIVAWPLGMVSGSMWGLLVGLLFLHPVFGLLAGATAGAVGGALSDYGISDHFMRRVAASLEGGRAALFVMVGDMGDRVAEALAQRGGEVMRTNLDSSKEKQLMEVFERANEHAAA